MAAEGSGHVGFHTERDLSIVSACVVVRGPQVRQGLADYCECLLGRDVGWALGAAARACGCCARHLDQPQADRVTYSSLLGKDHVTLWGKCVRPLSCVDLALLGPLQKWSLLCRQLPLGCLVCIRIIIFI